MKYIRTEDGIFKISQAYSNKDRVVVFYGKIINDEIGFCCKLPNKDIQLADTIEELCDELIIKYKSEKKPRYIDMTKLLKTCENIGVAFRKHIEWLFANYKEQLEICNGAIWTDKGLIYVAKMNEKGELELL